MLQSGGNWPEGSFIYSLYRAGHDISLCMCGSLTRHTCSSSAVDRGLIWRRIRGLSRAGVSNGLTPVLPDFLLDPDGQLWQVTGGHSVALCWAIDLLRFGVH